MFLNLAGRLRKLSRLWDR